MAERKIDGIENGSTRVPYGNMGPKGGDLRDSGDDPPKFEVGTAHVSVPQYVEK